MALLVGAILIYLGGVVMGSIIRASKEDVAGGIPMA